MSGSRENGFDVWDVNTAANLLSINNNKAAAAHNATVLTTTAQGKHQILTADVKKPYIHISAFTLASHSSNTATSSSSLPAHLSALALSPSSHFLLAAASSSPSLYVFSLSSHPPSLAATFSSHYRPVTCLGWSADECFVVSGGEDGCVNVHALTDILRDEHTEDERQLRQYLPSSASLSLSSVGSAATSKPYLSFSSHSLAVTALSIPALSYQSLVFSASLDHSVHVHSLLSTQTVQRFSLPCALTTLVALQTGTAVLAGGNDGNIYYQPLISSATKTAATSALARPPATASSASASSLSYTTLSGHSGSIHALATSSTSSLLASSSADGSIRLWDLHTLHCVRTLHKSSRPAYTYLTFAHSAPAPLAGVDWSGLRGSRAREHTSSLTVRAGQRGGRSGDMVASRARGELEAEWRSVRDEGELSEMRRALIEERRKREAVETELEQWKAVNRAMYRKVAAKLLHDTTRVTSSGRAAAAVADAADEPKAQLSGEDDERQQEADDDEVQILGETEDDADENMKEAGDDNAGGHVITVD